MTNLRNINVIGTPDATFPTVLTPSEESLPETDPTCMKLWDKGAEAGLEKLYLNRIAEEHRQKLGKLFLPAKGKSYLDAGCGAGSMFKLICSRIRPAEVYAVDWSKVFLEKAQLEEARLRPLFSQTCFRFPNSNPTKPAGWVDLMSTLPWPDNFFDGCISNQVVCYLTCGWEKPIEEMTRVTKPGGYLYLGSLLSNWGFTKVLWKHFLPEFLRAPVVSIRGLKCRRVLDEISKEAKRRGAQFPIREKLIAHLKTLEWEEIKVIPTYWGGSLALRAKLKAKPLS